MINLLISLYGPESIQVYYNTLRHTNQISSSFHVLNKQKRSSMCLGYFDNSWNNYPCLVVINFVIPPFTYIFVNRQFSFISVKYTVHLNGFN